MHAPQIIYIVLLTLTCFFGLENHGKPREGKHNFWTTLLGVAIIVALLMWGGFFAH